MSMLAIMRAKEIRDLRKNAGQKELLFHVPEEGLKS